MMFTFSRVPTAMMTPRSPPVSTVYGALAILLLQCLQVEGARVLGMFPSPGRSHHMFFQPVMKALAQAGHQVTVYSPFPHDNPPHNYTDVTLDLIMSYDLSQWIMKLKKEPRWKSQDLLFPYMDKSFYTYVERPQVKKLIKSKTKFDVIFTESLVMQEYTLILGHIFKAPVIVLNAFFNTPIIKSVLGNELSVAHIPDLCMEYSSTMSFTERAVNAFSILRYQYLHYNHYLPRLESKMKKVFPDMPPLTDLLENIALVFSNHHPSYYPEPQVPKMISIGGIHTEGLSTSTSQMLQDIQTFMDEAPDGVILFSLGTYVPDEMFPDSYFDMYVNVFKKLPQRVLWKTKREKIEGLPSNVMAKSWLPQTEVLGHRGCVLFITHGGLHSTYEAIHYSVPVVVIPQFYDQRRNARYLEVQGVGVRLTADNLSETVLSTAIRSIMEEPSYRQNMTRLSRIFRDRPLSPAQSVVYWTEYVLRHGGAPHLQAASARLPWYQLALLDILASALILLATVLSLGYLLLKRITSKRIPEDDFTEKEAKLDNNF